FAKMDHGSVRATAGGRFPSGYRLYASMSWVGNLILLAYNNVNVWMLRYFFSAKEVGFFSVATRIPGTLVALVLVPLGAPLLYNLGPDQAGAGGQSGHLAEAVGLLSVMMGCLCLALAATSSWVIATLFGAQFVAAVPAYAISAPLPFLMAYQG